MKCFNCSASIADETFVCPRCGAHQGFTPELIERAKNNDQGALTELYNKTYSNVYYTVKALIRDEDAALDILQDSYIKAFKSLDQLKEPEKFRAWIKMIAHNRAVDYLRVHKPVLFTQMESDDSDTELEFEDTHIENLPEEVVDRDETARLMREILDSLPDEQRVVLSMYYYEQLSVGEIAAELGVSEGTVKSRLNYGRKKVETKVLDLEKQGTKLYGLAPIPFMLFLFKSQSAYPAPVAPSICGNILAASSGSAAAAAGSSAAGTAAGTAAKTGLLAAFKASLAAKIIAGVLAVSIVAGTVTAVVRVNQLRREKNEDASAANPEILTEDTDPVNAADGSSNAVFENISGEFTDPNNIFSVNVPAIYADFGVICANEDEFPVYTNSYSDSGGTGVSGEAGTGEYGSGEGGSSSSVTSSTYFPVSAVSFGNKYFVSAQIVVYENDVYDLLLQNDPYADDPYKRFILASNDQYTAVYELTQSRLLDESESNPYQAERGSDMTHDYTGKEAFYIEQLHELDLVKDDLLQSFAFVSGSTVKPDHYGYEITSETGWCRFVIPPMWHEYGIDDYEITQTKVGYSSSTSETRIDFGTNCGTYRYEGETYHAVDLIYFGYSDDPEFTPYYENSVLLGSAGARKFYYALNPEPQPTDLTYGNETLRQIDQRLRNSTQTIIDSFEIIR